MAYTAGCCSLKAKFIPLGIAFGTFQKSLEQFRFYSVWKKWDILEGDLKETGTMLQLRDHKQTDFWMCPFVRDVWMIMK